MTTILLALSIILLISGILVIFGAFGYAMLKMYNSIDIMASDDHDTINKEITSVTKSNIASIAAIIFGGGLSMLGWIMAVIVMSFSVVTP